MGRRFDLRQLDALGHGNYKRAALAGKDQLLLVGSQRRRAFIRDRIHTALEMLCLSPLAVHALAHVDIAARIEKSTTGQRVRAMTERRTAFAGRNKKEQRLIGTD